MIWGIKMIKGIKNLFFIVILIALIIFLIFGMDLLIYYIIGFIAGFINISAMISFFNIILWIAPKKPICLYTIFYIVRYVFLVLCFILFASKTLDKAFIFTFGVLTNNFSILIPVKRDTRR